MNYLFIYSTEWKHYSGSTAALLRQTLLSPMLRMEITIAFHPELTPKPTVTCSAVSLLPWDTHFTSVERGATAFTSSTSCGQDVRTATSKNNVALA